MLAKKTSSKRKSESQLKVVTKPTPQRSIEEGESRVTGSNPSSGMKFSTSKKRPSAIPKSPFHRLRTISSGLFDHPGSFTGEIRTVKIPATPNIKKLTYSRSAIFSDKVTPFKTEKRSSGLKKVKLKNIS